MIQKKIVTSGTLLSITRVPARTWPRSRAVVVMCSSIGRKCSRMCQERHTVRRGICPDCEHGAVSGSRIVLVEDDPAISDPLSRGLRREGYEVEVATDRVNGLQLAMDPTVPVVILDVGLPHMNGLEVCRRLRSSRPKVQILLLTALAEEVNAVDGLDAGADDYVAKPFRLGELLARVRAALRRAEPGQLAAAGVRVDRASHRAFLDDDELALSPKEFALLARLLEDAAEVDRPLDVRPLQRLMPHRRLVVTASNGRLVTAAGAPIDHPLTAHATAADYTVVVQAPQGPVATHAREITAILLALGVAA